jgi:hypothetical protein
MPEMEMIHKIPPGRICPGTRLVRPERIQKLPDEKCVREYARECEGVKKLPRGF